MKNFKFFQSENQDGFLSLEPMQQLTLMRREFNNVEFCFQFDDNEPYVFGGGSNNLVITINPTADGNITFQDNGQRFKIFARERQ